MNGNTRPVAATDRATMLEEPGAEDNRLSLDPSDPRWEKTLAAWKDGGIYDIGAKIQQIAPGEFRIVNIKASTAPSEAAEEEGEPSDNPQEEAEEMQSGSMAEHPNPAMARMMREEDRY